MKIIRFLIVFILFPFIGTAQILDSLDIYDHKEFENQTLKVYSDSGLIKLQVIKPSLIKVSFSKRNNSESQNEFSSFDSTYVRITQNLESIFMQTDSLLVVISKLDFSIKFQNLKEQLYTTNQTISFSKDGLNLKFSRAEHEQFYDKKLKRIKAKKYSITKTKSIFSSKNYKIYFDDNVSGDLNFTKKFLFEISLINSNAFEYYISTELVY